MAKKKKVARRPAAAAAAASITSSHEKLALTGGRYCTLVLRSETSPLTAAARENDHGKAIEVEISMENFLQLEVPILSSSGGQRRPFCFELPLPLGPDRFSGSLDPARHLSLNPGAVASAAAALFEEFRRLPRVGSFFWRMTMKIIDFAAGLARRGLRVWKVCVDAKFMSMRATSAKSVAELAARIQRQRWCERPPEREAAEEVCAVCLEEMKAGWLRTSRLPCRHEYHVGCVAPWVERKNSCPLCRSKVLR